MSHLTYAKSLSNDAASCKELIFESDGKKMSGLIYQAAGKGPHPSELLLHSCFGNDTTKLK
ncbi:hypothetical protein NBRC116595_30860 [Aliiglaciecola sp. NS0011-25]